MSRELRIKGATALKDLRHDMLVAMASGYHHSMVFSLFCRRLEAMLPGTTCSVIDVDRDDHLHSVAAPSLPPAFANAVAEEEVGPASLWGGAAIAQGQTVAVRDIAGDQSWQHCKSRAAEFNIRGAWSTPVKSRDGRVIGAVSLYFAKARNVRRNEANVVAGFLDLCAIAIEASKAKEKLNELALFDQLTGLGNRGMFKDRVGRILQHALDAQRTVGFFYIDLDEFRVVNNLYGQANGDVLLSKFANRLRSVVPDAELVVRMGSDQFLIAKTLDSDCTDFETIARQIVDRIRGTYELEDGTPVALSASVGVARFPFDGSDEDALIAHAETAMHSVDERGFVVFASEMRAIEQKRRLLERDAGLADRNNELFVVYQPQAATQSCTICGFEALLRWQHPQFGFVPPSDFIPIAEASGAIAAMGAFVLQEACLEAASWPVPLRVAVNASPAQIVKGDFAQVVKETLLRTGLKPERLEVEVTESLLIQDSTKALKVLDKIKNMGVSVALDDFGTGYSSLSTLRAFPFDRIKIDRSFIFDMTTNTDAAAIVNSVMSLGKALHLTVVAEGVESEEQLNLLRLLGCDLVQGYLIGKPLRSENYRHVTGLDRAAAASAA